MSCISVSYLDEEISSVSLLLSGVALLNWFTKISQFKEGFNGNKLLFLSLKKVLMVISDYDHFLDLSTV